MSSCFIGDLCPQLKYFVTHIKFLSYNVLIEAWWLVVITDPDTHYICRCVHIIVGRVRTPEPNNWVFGYNLLGIK